MLWASNLLFHMNYRIDGHSHHSAISFQHNFARRPRLSEERGIVCLCHELVKVRIKFPRGGARCSCLPPTIVPVASCRAILIECHATEPEHHALRPTRIWKCLWIKRRKCSQLKVYTPGGRVRVALPSIRSASHDQALATTWR